MFCECSSSKNYFRNNLSAFRRICEGEKLLPLPPAPTESRLLSDILGAAMKCERRFPCKIFEERDGLSAMNAAQALAWGRRATDSKTRRHAAGWQVRFCFSLQGGTIGALWLLNLIFRSDFYAVCERQVLYRMTEECAQNQEARGFGFQRTPQPNSTATCSPAYHPEGNGMEGRLFGELLCRHLSNLPTYRDAK